MIPVRAVTAFIALLEYEEGCVRHNARVVAPGKGELTDRLLGEHGVHVVLHRCAHVAGGRKPQPVAAADRRLFVSKRNGRGEREDFVKTLRILR